MIQKKKPVCELQQKSPAIYSGLMGGEVEILPNCCLPRNFKMPRNSALEMPFTCIYEAEVDWPTKTFPLLSC